MHTGYVPMKNEKAKKFKPESKPLKDNKRKPDYSELRKAKRGE